MPFLNSMSMSLEELRREALAMRNAILKELAKETEEEEKKLNAAVKAAKEAKKAAENAERATKRARHLVHRHDCSLAIRQGAHCSSAQLGAPVHCPAPSHTRWAQTWSCTRPPST
jgi:hypothetical protein